MKLAFCTLNGRDGHEAGRSLLRQLYFEETGCELPDIRIDGQGKPFFRDSKYFFSITHTNRHAFCVLSEHNVGIDAEEQDRRIRPGLIKKVLSPTEQRQFDSAPDPNRAFLTFWVLKEAAAKLSGEGLHGYPNHTAFQLNDCRVQEIDGCLVAVLEETEPPSDP